MEILDQLAGVIPAKYQSLIIYTMILGRVIQAIRTGGGLKSIFGSIWLGSNTPKKTRLETWADSLPKQPKQPADKTPPPPTTAILGLLLAALVFAPGCSSTKHEPEAIRFFTLQDTRLIVDAAERAYAEAAVQGQIKASDQIKVDNSIRTFHASYKVAIAAARADWTAPTPGDVQSAADALIRLIFTLVPKEPAP